MRWAENDKAEDAVYKWFIQKCSQGQPISGLVLCEKVLIFREKLGGDPQFKARNGWVRNFKAGQGIHDLKIHREKMSANTESADDFVFKFKTKTEKVTTVMISCTLLMKLACNGRLFFEKLQLRDGKPTPLAMR